MSTPSSRPTTSYENKNRSMLSTNHMSFNYSHATNFYKERKGNKSALITYSSKPFQKGDPQWNQSAATWRNSSPKCSFPKDARFKDIKSKYTDIIKLEIPSTRSSRSCTFGKDHKKPISQVVLRNAKQKPSPDCYSMKKKDEQTRKISRGKTFGLGWKTYEKVYLTHRKDVYSSFQNEENPGAHYEVRQTPGKEKNKFSMYGRLKMYTQKLTDDKKGIPGSKYDISRRLRNTQGVNGRSFGFGDKIDFSLPANDYPGPDKYTIPGLCDKFDQNSSSSNRHRPYQFTPSRNSWTATS